MSASAPLRRWAELASTTGAEVDEWIGDAAALGGPTLEIASRNPLRGEALRQALGGTRHVVVHAEGLPAAVWLDAVVTVLRQADDHGWDGELQVVGGDAPRRSPPAATAGVARARPHDRPVDVWVPHLGTSGATAWLACYRQLVPRRVFPLMELPARDPRQVDQTSLEHAELLDAAGVRPGDWLHVSQFGPHDAYRRVADLLAGQHQLGRQGPSLISIGTTAAVALGAALAGYEHGAGLDTDLAAASTGHVAGRSEGPGWCAWLLGSPYRP